MTRVAIVGGGPAGLMSAHLLERQPDPCASTTLFEASGRLGGKMQTRTFDAVPVTYEAGVAECYDFQSFGYDPLRALIETLGLVALPTDSSAIVLNGSIVRDDADILRCFGAATLEAIQAFRARASATLPPDAWYRGFGPEHNCHPWARCSAAEVLDSLADPIARKYFKVMTHSDMATEPHLVNGLVGLRNVLKSVRGYGAQYTIQGGMEMLARRLAASLASTRAELNARVVRVSRTCDDRYTVRWRRGQYCVEECFDAVVLALPCNHLQAIEMAGDRLRRAMTAHVAHYDSPAHYFRISVLFRTPFWRRLFSGSWIMLDAFGGCCVYDESATQESGGYGVLGWLLAGADALTLCNMDDRTVLERVIESLPTGLRQHARNEVIEAKVHRWAGAVVGQPGGLVLRDPSAAHCPEPVDHPRLVVAGDYLFDSTLNGVLRSARTATMLLARSGAEAIAPSRTATGGEPRRTPHQPEPARNRHGCSDCEASSARGRR